MAIAAYIEFFDHQGRRIEGACRIQGRERMVEAMAFSHGLRIPADADSAELTATRKHEFLEFTEYFTHELKGVKVSDIRSTMLNVKHPKNERYPPLEMVSLRYEEITWMHLGGNIAFTDAWDRRTT